MSKRNIILALAFVLILAFVLVSCDKKSYTVTFDSQGGTQIQSVTVEKGDKVSEPNTPYLQHHTFLGWYDGDKLWDFSTKVRGDINLVAKWTLTEYNITFDSKTGSNNKATFTVQDLPLRLYEAKADGDKHFLGWEMNGNRINKLVSVGDVTIKAIYQGEPTDLIYEEHNDHVVVIGAMEQTTDLVIPSTYNGKPVTKIADGAFKSNEDIYTLIIEGGVAEIGKEAFKDCKNLQKVVFGDDLKKISDSAFMNCSGIYEAPIPNGLEYIGAKAFKGCSFLESINLPDGLRYLGEDFILDCPNVKYDMYTNGEVQDKYLGNWLIEYADREARSIVLKEGTVGIASYAFYQMTNLRTIHMPAGVKYIGSHAFFFCYNVTVVNLNSDLEYIGMYAFYRLQKLKTITIPLSVTTIGMKTFEKCVALTITCEAEKAPEGFGQDWNGGREVIYAGQN